MNSLYEQLVVIEYNTGFKKSMVSCKTITHLSPSQFNNVLQSYLSFADVHAAIYITKTTVER